MITLQRNKQKMIYALQGSEMPIYERDENGNVIYYVDDEGNRFPMETGETEQVYCSPVAFYANINNKLDEAALKEFGIDDSTKFAQIVTAKGQFPFKVGTIIWKKSDVGYKDNEQTVIDETTADYTVMGVADEGLNYDLFLLQKNV